MSGGEKLTKRERGWLRAAAQTAWLLAAGNGAPTACDSCVGGFVRVRYPSGMLLDLGLPEKRPGVFDRMFYGRILRVALGLPEPKWGGKKKGRVAREGKAKR